MSKTASTLIIERKREVATLVFGAAAALTTVSDQLEEFINAIQDKKEVSPDDRDFLDLLIWARQQQSRLDKISVNIELRKNSEAA